MKRIHIGDWLYDTALNKIYFVKGFSKDKFGQHATVCATNVKEFTSKKWGRIYTTALLFKFCILLQRGEK